MTSKISSFRRWLRWHEGSIALLILAIAMALIILSGASFGQSYPLPKHGQCPSGWMTSGSYCSPSNDNQPRAIPKVGQCPSGWLQSGNYCLEMSHSNRSRLTQTSVLDIARSVARMRN